MIYDIFQDGQLGLGQVVGMNDCHPPHPGSITSSDMLSFKLLENLVYPGSHPGKEGKYPVGFFRTCISWKRKEKRETKYIYIYIYGNEIA